MLNVHKAVDCQGLISTAHRKIRALWQKGNVIRVVDSQGIVHLEFLKLYETLNAHLYVQHLQHVYKGLIEKRPALVNQKNVILLHENSKPHSATGEKIEIGWLVLSHRLWHFLIAAKSFDGEFLL